MWLSAALPLSSPTAGPGACLQASPWRAHTWSSAKTPTASKQACTQSAPPTWPYLTMPLCLRFYSRSIRASAILNGDVEPPTECADLYHVLEAYTEAYTADWTSKNMPAKVNVLCTFKGFCFSDSFFCSIVLELFCNLFYEMMTLSARKSVKMCFPSMWTF